jgi:hypothetical protein
MWSVGKGICVPMNPLEIGTLDVSPPSSTSTSALNYNIPCGYRDATIEYNCVFDGECLAVQSMFFLVNSVQNPRLCMPINNVTLYKLIFENPAKGIPFSAIGPTDHTSLETLLGVEIGVPLQVGIFFFSSV